MDDKQEIRQEIKELRNQFHSIDKSLESFRSMSSTQHENIESLLKDNISKIETILKDHDSRLDKVEDAITEIKTENENRKKNHNVLVGISATCATIFAVVIGAVLDHYLFK